MINDYDVIIAGAGPAGLSAAKTVAELGLKCLIIEKNEEVGYPVRTSGASWYNDMVRLGIPKKYLNPLHRISLVGPHEEITIDFEDPVACILDVTEVYKFLASQATQYGAELRLQTKVKDIIIERGFVCGLRIQDKNNSEEIRCKVVVDATGFNAALVKKLGYIKKWPRKAVGVQYDIQSSDIDHDSASLFVGRRIAPSGYGWFFPWRKNRARVGVGIIRPDSSANPNLLADALLKSDYLSKCIGNYKIIRKETGMFPCSGPIKRTVANGFIAVGDSAGMGSPLHGEGIRYAIKFGRLAGEVIFNAITKGKVSAENLYIYEKKWRKMEERNFKIGLSIQKRIAKYTDQQWDRAIRYLKKIAYKDQEVIIELFKSNFSYRNIWRLFKHTPSIALKMLLGEK